jgi:hypothetical protein
MAEMLWRVEGLSGQPVALSVGSVFGELLVKPDPKATAIVAAVRLLDLAEWRAMANWLNKLPGMEHWVTMFRAITDALSKEAANG